jgi:hypothetical protein
MIAFVGKQDIRDVLPVSKGKALHKRAGGMANAFKPN